MLLEHEGDYGLGMDAMVTVCSWNTNEIMVVSPPNPPPPPRGKNLFNHTASYRRRLQKHTSNHPPPTTRARQEHVFRGKDLNEALVHATGSPQEIGLLQNFA